MEKQIPLGPEGSIDLKLEGGMVIVSISHKHASGEVSVVAKEDLKYFAPKLKALIPGKVDDMLIDFGMAALP